MRSLNIFMRRIKNVEDVVKWRMCIGCGACVYACPEDNIKMTNIENDGIRPFFLDGDCEECTECLKVCPGYEIDATVSTPTNSYLNQIYTEWGPVLEVWEGYSAEDQVRYSGSSAGLATILAVYCLEKKNMQGVLHIGANNENPLDNKTYFSKNRNEIISKTGSRYSPASPCDSLDKIEQMEGPCVFIGKPCDVRGLRKAQDLKKSLSKNVGITISIFCAGTPSLKGTKDLLIKEGINVKEVKSLRYRGNGWPGKFIAVMDNGTDIELSYQESWGFLQAYRPFRCHLCPEGTGDAADVACGDPWYKDVKENDRGSSLILVRSEIGRKILYNAIKDGYIVAQKVEPSKITKSQYNLLSRKMAIWGRLLAFKIIGIPSPKFKGFYLLRNWMSNSLVGKMKSILGTFKRILMRRYYRPFEYR